ncbi:MAG: hypothetical protein P8Z40_15745 [Chloroflexota bacterium]
MDWIAPPDLTIPTELREAVGGHPLVAEILARRGITDVETARAFLDPAYYTPSPPGDIPDLLGSESWCGATLTWTARPRRPCYTTPCATWGRGWPITCRTGSNTGTGCRSTC